VRASAGQLDGAVRYLQGVSTWSDGVDDSLVCGPLVEDLPGFKPHHVLRRPRGVPMLLQQFGLGVVRRPAAPGTMEPALTRRVCFRKVSSQPAPGSCRIAA